MHPVHQEVHQSYFPRRKMAPFSSASTFRTLTRSPRRIATPYCWSQTSLTNLVQPKSTLSLTCTQVTTMSTSPLVMSGKQCFGPDMAPLNFLSCQWDLPMCQPHFNTLWMTSSKISPFSQFIPNKKDQPMCTKCPIYRVGQWSAKILFGSFSKRWAMMYLGPFTLGWLWYRVCLRIGLGWDGLQHDISGPLQLGSAQI